MFCMDTDYFTKLHQVIMFCNTDGVCLLQSIT
jgi:hypothetical protein